MALNKKTLRNIIIISALFILFLFFYLLPFVFGSLFINVRLVQINECGNLTGFELEIENSYFLPVTLSYPGSDIRIDILNNNGSKIHEASFLDERLHDDEEGDIHVSRFSPGSSNITVSMNQSSQFYRTSVLPVLNDGNYKFNATAFGEKANPVYDYRVDKKSEMGSC